MRPEKKYRAAIAIHPYLPTYDKEPSRQFMQDKLNDDSFHQSLAVTINDTLLGRPRTLYVNPKKILISPDVAERQIINGHSYDFFHHEDLTKTLISENGETHTAITLMGGETFGCHPGAYKDIVNWFFDISPLTELTIIIPIEGIFTSGNLPFSAYKQPWQGGNGKDDYFYTRLKASYSDSRADSIELNSNEIVCTFSK